MPFTAILQRSYRCQKLSNSIWSCLHAFKLGHSDSRHPPAFVFCPPHRRRLPGSSPLPKKATTMNSSVSCGNGNNTSRTPAFWRPRSSPFANFPAKMCPLSTGHSVTLQERPILMMLCAMSSSSPHSSKGWPFLLFGGKNKKLNQQCLRTQLVWHLKVNRPWTSAANILTLTRGLLTTWPVLRRPRVNSFPISFSSSKNKLND